MDFSQPANESRITTTAEALKANGMSVTIVSTAEEAKAKALELVPEGSEVMTMTSVTLDETGLSAVFNESGAYDAVKPKLYSLDRATHGKEMQRMGAAADYSIGSVHAIDESGNVYIASNSGSQLPGYAYGSPHVVWIVGAQKLVKDANEAMQRIHEHVLPQESERAKKAYGVPGSNVSKLLTFHREPNKDRIHVILVKQKLGY
jgi:L-lactate utilization protein LutC